MQAKVDELTSQVNSLLEEKEQLKATHADDEKRVELLCAIVGEQSTLDPLTREPAVEYLGDQTFRHVASGQVAKVDNMVARCLEMVSSFEGVLAQRSSSLLGEKKEE